MIYTSSQWIGGRVLGQKLNQRKPSQKQNDLLYVVVTEAVFRKEYNSRERANQLEM